ncbi:MAG: MaoC family dehydratase N-terminal domain-containing protein [Acidimicrobiia bacterium]|nr:MaoC family dehydratase N-terminal domain-containing protein [Acidimicrobiia bacterium]
MVAAPGPGPEWGRITEEGLARLLERLDQPRRRRGSMMRRGARASDDASLLTVSRELNGRYARAVADLNPLYVDDGYAAASVWGRLLVPPGILAWTEVVNGATDGFPGCHTIWRECALTWERPVFVGEALASTTYLRGARIVESRFGGGPSAVQDYETITESPDGEPVGTYRTSWHRFERTAAKDASKHGDVERPRWTEEELEEVWAEYRRQNLSNRRGALPLFWEDVEVGTDLPYIVKGPTTLTSKLAFECLGWPGGWVVGHELAIELFAEHPGLPIRNEENVPEPPVAIHWTNERCQRYLGMPAAYEAGYERLNWLTQLLMAWAGDDGVLRALSMRFEGFHWQGDLIRLFGRVTGKRRDGAARLVDLEVETRTQRDDRTTVGTAVVALPSREGRDPDIGERLTRPTVAKEDGRR